MTTIDWSIKGREFVNCNCDYGCPCQFNALPTHGDCRAVLGFQIDEGHHGDTRLDGLQAAMVVSWPGPIHKGNGTMLVIIDEQANEEQRQALLRIMQGEDTEEMATMWWVYSAMCPNKLEPLFKPIEFEVDVKERTGRLTVPDLIVMVGEPIRNPVTGDVHQARIDLPHGFEYSIAEIGSATATVKGPIPMDLKDSYGQFAELHLSNTGRMN